LSEQKAKFAHLKAQRNIEDKDAYTDNSGEVLVERLRSGNGAAAAELVDRFYGQIYLYFRRLGHNRQLSEDLTQESFILAWKHIGQLRDGKALKGWLYKIAANVSRLELRQRKKEKLLNIEETQLQFRQTGIEKSEQNEQLERLRSFVVKLPVKLKDAIILHYMQHLTISEAAEAAGINEGTFKSRLSKALKILRKDFIPEGENQNE